MSDVQDIQIRNSTTTITQTNTITIFDDKLHKIQLSDLFMSSKANATSTTTNNNNVSNGTSTSADQDL